MSILTILPILFLADSHGVGPFGEGVEEQLRHVPGAKVHTVAIGASQPDSFFNGFTTPCGYEGDVDEATPPRARPCRRVKTPLLPTLLRGQSVVVALGTNLIYDPRGFAYARSSIERMVKVLQRSGGRCVWIGPPKMRRFPVEKQRQLYEALAVALRGDTRFPPCELIDSRDYTEYPAKGGDGIHYAWSPAVAALGRAWGETVGRLAAQALRR